MKIEMLKLLDEVLEYAILLPILHLTLANVFQSGQDQYDLQCVKRGQMAEDLVFWRQDHGSHFIEHINRCTTLPHR